MRYLPYILFMALVASACVAWETFGPKNCAPSPPRDFTNAIGMKFVWIPPGRFLMGSAKGDYEAWANKTQHEVVLTRGFFMAVYTVTQEEWQAVMRHNPSKFRGQKNLPVEMVSWNDCQEFIKKMTATDHEAKS